MLEVNSGKELIEAVKKGDFEAVETLLASGADVNARDDKGWTPDDLLKD